MFWLSPVTHREPQKTIGARPVSMGAFNNDRLAALAVPGSFRLMVWASQRALIGGRRERVGQSTDWVYANTFSGLTAPPVLTEASGDLEGFAISQHVERGPRELVRERLHGYHGHAPGLLALIEASRLRTAAHGNSSSLDEDPREVLVAVLGIAFAFLHAVRDAPAFNAPTVGTELADSAETGNGARLQHDRGCECHSDAGCSFEDCELGTQFYFAMKYLLDYPDPCLQSAHDREVCGQGSLDMRRQTE